MSNAPVSAPKPAAGSGYSYDDIIECSHAVPELEALLRQMMVLHNEFRHPVDWSVVMRAAELDLAAHPDRLWAYGTVAELWLLASIGGIETSADPADEQIKAIRLLVQRAQGHRAAPIALDATRRQLDRHVF